MQAVLIIALALSAALSADPSPDLAAYRKACLAEGKKQIDQLTADLRTAAKADRPAISAKIQALRKSPPLIGLPDFNPGSVGTLTRQLKVIEAKGAKSATVCVLIPIYDTDGIRGAAPLGTARKIAQLRTKVGDKDGPPFALVGIDAKGWQAGELVTLPADQVFAVRADGTVEAVEIK